MSSTNLPNTWWISSFIVQNNFRKSNLWQFMQAKDEMHLLNIKGQQCNEAVIEYDALSVHFSKDESQMHHVSVMWENCNLKLWCLQFVLPRLMWPLTVVDIPLNDEKVERMISSYVRKWIGAPRSLNIISLYGHGMLELPTSRKSSNALKQGKKWHSQNLEIHRYRQLDHCCQQDKNGH